MEAEWQETARIEFPPPGIQAPPTPCTALAFDTTQELLWTGNGYGRVTSFYGPELQKYTSYRGHEPREGAVKQILPLEKGILSISANSIHFSIRRGLAQWHLNNPDFVDLRCVCTTSKDSSRVLVAGCQSKMFKIHADMGEITETATATAHYTMLRRAGSYVCAATVTGYIHVLDPESLQVVKEWKAHGGWINDMDANGSFLVTCGVSPRQHYGNMPDPMAKVFDMKKLESLPPVSFHAGASFVRMHPRMITTAVVASQHGQMQLVDIMNPSMVNVRQVVVLDENYLLGLDFAPSSNALAITDSQCTIQLWGHPSKVNFSDYSNPTEFADATPPTQQIMDWNSNAPLSSIGMPYYRETLLSTWPSHLLFEVGAPPGKIEPEVLQGLRKNLEMGFFNNNPKTRRRYQAEKTRSDAERDELEGPRFLSEQAKDGESSGDSPRRMSEMLEALEVSRANGQYQAEIPPMYRNVEIKYSRFGVDDFDFEYYNRTIYSGLETHIANSYANPLLQVLRFTPYARNAALHHTATSCLVETCLLCEMGFLFDMLEKAQGQNCQATNFLKTFSNLPHAASLGLLEETSSRPITQIVQSMNRFLLEKIANDYRLTAPPGRGHIVEYAFATAAKHNKRCVCGSKTEQPGGTYVHELVYPETPLKAHVRTPGDTFSRILKMSVERQDQVRGWCSHCRRYQQLTATRVIRSMPPVLMINTAIQSVTAKQLWSRYGWLPKEIGVILTPDGQFFCYEGKDLESHKQRGAHNITVYQLVGIVADISGGAHQQSHLVSAINVAHAAKRKQDDEWILFNDFLVRPISETDALNFDASWKLPSILTYQDVSWRHHVDNSWQNYLDPTMLFQQYELVTVETDPKRFQLLDMQHERPRPGTEVGIDAEFVALQQEEIEIKADGSRSILRPSRLALARVSVLRGGESLRRRRKSDLRSSSLHPMSQSGHEEMTCNDDDEADDARDAMNIPFVDDYISISEPIVDYLTQYSGISPGDLDLRKSPHAASGRLVSLKAAYKKVWLLLNLGCVFVGHGLLKDFRTINIHVPKKQVIDTVELYYLKSRGRKLSLRFLSWLLLNEEVQVGMHDSIEDARTALRLWEKWKEFEREGRVDKVLSEIYRRGRDVAFKVPGSGIKSSFGTDLGKRSSSEVRGVDSMPGTPRGKTAGLVQVSGLSPEKE